MSLRLGKYELVSRLAKGGMAETFRARLEGAAGVTKQVVIKKVLPELAEDQDFIAAFIDEARLSASLSHGNIAQVFEFGQVDGDYFLAMEWVDGRSLAQILRRAAELQIAFLPPSIACFLAIEVLKALHYAHTRTGEDGKPLNLVHRDVSPENILVSFEGQAKVIDFGIAKASLPRNQETAPGLVKGKFLYFSPEQACAQPLDGRSDVFALGVVLYEMLSGAKPFHGQMHVVIQAIQQGRFTPVEQVNPLLPARLAEVVAKAMTRDLSLRYGSALEMQQALTRLLYREDPAFSSETVKDWMRSLFSGPGALPGEEDLQTAPARDSASARGSSGSGRAAGRPALAAPAAAPAGADASAASAGPAPALLEKPAAQAETTPLTPGRIGIGVALAGLVLAAFTIAALLAEPEPIDRPVERAPALARPPVFAAPRPAAAATPVDTLVYPASAVVRATRHRLRFDGLALPSVTFAAGATPQLVEREASDEDSPLFFRASSTDPVHDGAIRLVLQRPVPLPAITGGTLFDFHPFDTPLRGAIRKVEAGEPPVQLEFADARTVVDVRAAGWLTMESVPPGEKVKLTLRALEPKAWAGRPRGASVLVVWKRAFGRLLPPPGGDWPDELDRAVLTADKPLVVEHATALAFAFADPLA
ncbi:MAG: masK9, partial [Myxococcaceae bacterium]|nr:masK9 [Myxococcaceae bacterium]